MQINPRYTIIWYDILNILMISRKLPVDIHNDFTGAGRAQRGAPTPPGISGSRAPSAEAKMIYIDIL